jgi:CxxC motif-containing protein (DUF1111 family)
MKRCIQVGTVIFAALAILPMSQSSAQDPARLMSLQEAPAGFDNQTNGYLSQSDFDEFLDTFSEADTIADGLGPTFNDTSCLNCHKVPVTGGSSTTLERRAGKLSDGLFIEHPGGSLVQDHVIKTCPSLQEAVGPDENSTFRTSVSTLGDGFIEAIDDDTIIAISRLQPPDMRGMVIRVPVLEAKNPRVMRVGRFGWKNQHASLESFSADAYLNEIGITSPLLPVENTSDGRSVASCDAAKDPEDVDGDVRKFADFIRATKVPPRGPISPAEDGAGLALFIAVGCATCHVPVLVTAPTGTAINGGTFRVPPALGNKIIHPFSDFLLHDVGTYDPIVQNGGSDTYNKVRTPPLWGLRTRTILMHDGQSTSIADAISRHGGQAARSAAAFQALSRGDKARLLTFLNSL